MSFSRRQKLKLLGKLDKAQRHVVHLRAKLDKCRGKQVVRVADVAKCARLRAKEERLSGKLASVLFEMQDEWRAMVQMFDASDLPVLAARYGMVRLLELDRVKPFFETAYFPADEPPIIEAAIHGHLNCVKFLANNNVNINRTSKHGQTALHVAAAAHNLEILLFLLSQPNIDVHARDSNYRTALDVARHHSTINGDKYGFYANCILALEAKSTAAPVAAPPVLAPSTADVAQVVLETPEAGGTTCITCTERQRDTVFVPCGHRVLCLTCVGSLTSRRRPLCRASIREFMRTYDS
ncbi:unnamed protein product [Aphanomyces euteiches]|uniref:RING-type domain-containing protein n=1 Tax=Aphanomyces euteiches TaxID=100861 RepID=A0A6G0XC71_9STRA|nr:hypothetical protein Ae201684_006342 [Aphanomyces euteiches]KAH9090793.1 hypothetical protein Ae201684P_006198 [Aphanomyces euteiches]KAH9138747.1 hypothetical protein AeRB84_016943 [Aphanomyces euteiches]